MMLSCLAKLLWCISIIIIPSVLLLLLLLLVMFSLEVRDLKKRCLVLLLPLLCRFAALMYRDDETVEATAAALKAAVILPRSSESAFLTPPARTSAVLGRWRFLDSNKS